MEKFLNDIKACLENHYKQLIEKTEVYVSAVNMTIDRAVSAPLWLNMQINNELLACDISNNPQSETRFLTVSFFWRNDKCKMVSCPSHARSVGPLFWETLNFSKPIGYVTARYRHHGEFRLQKIYDTKLFRPADIAHEIEYVLMKLHF